MSLFCFSGSRRFNLSIQHYSQFIPIRFVIFLCHTNWLQLDHLIHHVTLCASVHVIITSAVDITRYQLVMVCWLVEPENYKLQKFVNCNNYNITMKLTTLNPKSVITKCCIWSIELFFKGFFFVCFFSFIRSPCTIQAFGQKMDYHEFLVKVLVIDWLWG